MKFLTLALFLCLAVSTFAQAQPDEVAAEFVTLSLGANLPSYYYRDGENIVKLEISQQGISYPVSYHGPTELALYDDPADLAPRDPDEPAPIPALQASLPTGENRILLLFSKDSTESESQPSMCALGISTEKMQAGDYRIFNFSKTKAYLMINNEKALIQPGKSADLSSPAWKSDIFDLQVILGIRQEENMRKVYSSVWGHMPARRTFLFIFDNPDRFRPIRVLRYHDAPVKRTNTSEE